jgi:hypothetical protein
MLLTGVVFLGTYAYKNFLGRLGPIGKLTLLYAMSGGLLGVGAWLYRKQETLKNYAQVLFAGGLAAVYFTTYAAHHIPTLRVINSPLVDGALLLGWAGIVVWLADKRKSEVLALFAVGLAFYSSVMTHVGLFTLYSNLILTLTGVFFLVRNRWATLSTVTLFASYGGYAFWRFYHGGEWHWAGPEEGLWKGTYFLICYWALFTAAVFTTTHEEFAGKKRASFLSVNNGAFFTLFILTMLQVRHGGFWKFALLYGSALVGLAAVCRVRFREDKLSSNAYLTQGLLLVTVGFITYYSGLKLALVLATESVLLTLSNRYVASRIIQLGAAATAALAVGFALATMDRLVRADLIIGSFIGAAMLLNAWGSRWKQNEKMEVLSTIWFTTLGLVVWFATTWMQTEGQNRGLALAIESAVFVLASRPLRNFALRHGALPYAAAAVAWAIYTMNGLEHSGLYTGLAIGALVLLDDLLTPEEEEASGSRTVTAKPLFTGLALLMWLWTTWIFTPPAHLGAVIAMEGLLFLFAWPLLKSKSLTVGGLAFIFIAQLLCLFNLLPKGTDLPLWASIKVPWWNPVLVAVISLGVTHWAQKQRRWSLAKGSSEALQLAFVLPFLAILFFWLHPHFSHGGWLAFTAVMALAVTVYGLATRLWVVAAAGQIYIAYSVLAFLRWVLFASGAAKPSWQLTLVPIAALIALSLLAQYLLRSLENKKSEWLNNIGVLYRAIAVTISIAWVFQYVHDIDHVWVFGLLGAACFAGLFLRKSRELLRVSAVYSGVAILVLWSRMFVHSFQYFPNLLVILSLLAQEAIAQRRADRFALPRRAHVAVMIVGLSSLWLWVSKWVAHEDLTAVWAVLALAIFVAGFALKEKIYRWSGLAVLTAALGRVVLHDIWGLGTIYRILSFMALGIVLLVLGLIYTKYQEKIREWL